MSDALRDHWWWRPGWEPGRRMLTVHLTFANDPLVCGFARAYRAAVLPLGLHDEVPDRWLHLSMQDIGFLDDLSARQIDEVTDQLTDTLADVPAFDIEFRPAEVGTEGVYLPVSASADLDGLRRAVREAIGATGLAVPGDPGGFWPHMSVAYGNCNAAAEPVIDAVSKVSADPIPATITHVDVILLSRDTHLYEWLPVAEIPLRRMSNA